MNQAYVSPLILSRVAASSVGHVGTPSLAGQARRRKTLGLASRLRQAEGDLHEDQLCESRSRSRVDRFADKPLHRRYDAVVQGQFIALDQRTESGRRQVWLGARIRRVLGFGVGRSGSLCLHRKTGRTSLQAGLRGGTEVVRRALRTGMAKGQGMKLLKQFHLLRPVHTPLKRGVNERGVTATAVHGINTRLESGVMSAGRENRFNGFPN